MANTENTEINCPDCDAAKRHAYSDATTPGFFHDRCMKHRGRIGTTPEEIASKHEQQQKMQGRKWGCGCNYCLEARLSGPTPDTERGEK